MPGPEFSQKANDEALIGLASKVLGEPYELGPVAASNMLKRQLYLVMPALPSKLKDLVADNILADEARERVDQALSSIEESAGVNGIGVAAKDWETALDGTNHLFYFGYIDYEDFNGEKGAFEASLAAHGRFTTVLFNIFYPQNKPDLYARRLVLTDAFAKKDEPVRIRKMRNVIHTSAAAGLFGERARTYVDPSAL